MSVKHTVSKKKKINDVISYRTQHAFQSEKVIKLFKVFIDSVGDTTGLCREPYVYLLTAHNLNVFTRWFKYDRD